MCIEDDCSEDISSRRSFLTTGAMATVAALTLRNSPEAQAQTKQAETRVLDDSTIQHGRVVFKHNGVETIDGYLARPKAEGVYPAVLVIAGNRITEEYIPNTCAALAVAGFVGLAPNIFHTLPDTARTPAESRAATINHAVGAELDHEAVAIPDRSRQRRRCRDRRPHTNPSRPT